MTSTTPRRTLSALFLALLALLAPVALAQPQPTAAIPDTPAGRQLAWIIDSINSRAASDLDSRFSDQFLKQVPAPSLKAGIESLRDAVFAGHAVRLGAIRPGSTDTTLTADIVPDGEAAAAAVVIHINPDSGKMEGLSIRPAKMETPALADFAALDAALQKLPGSANFGLFRLEPASPADASTASSPAPFSATTIHAFNPDTRLALGSAFKLYILGALAEEVVASRAAWDESLPIKDDLKSLPSGDMQNNPAGAAFPLSHYADKMISISDNTATDHLLFRTGRDKVEAYMSRLHQQPALNKPFLSTMEMFRIKLADDRDLAPRYAAADEPTRRAMIAPDGPAAAVQPNLALAQNWKTPTEITRVEWFASPPELAALMADLRRLEALPGMGPLAHALRINPGLPFDDKVWKNIAFKGGSEPGVINGAWMLERADGHVFVLTLGWNNPDALVDERIWAGLVMAAANLAAKEQ